MGCYSNSDTLSLNSIGIEENNLLSSVSVFPNPTNGLVTIELDKLPEESVKIEVMNIGGQLVTSKLITGCTAKCNESIDLSTYPKGEYLVKIKTAEETIIKRVMLK